MKKILMCALKALLATLLTLLALFIIIKIGIWFFSLDPVIGIIIFFAIITFITFFQTFYGNISYGRYSRYIEYSNEEEYMTNDSK